MVAVLIVAVLMVAVLMVAVLIVAVLMVAVEIEAVPSVAVPVETVRVELPPAISPVDVWLSVPPFMVTFDPFKLPERARVPADIVVAPV